MKWISQGLSILIADLLITRNIIQNEEMLPAPNTGLAKRLHFPGLNIYNLESNSLNSYFKACRNRRFAKPGTVSCNHRDMKIFNFFKSSINFSDYNVSKLTIISDALGDTLIKSGFGGYVDILTPIRLAADNHDENTFKKLVISKELFGGAGAMWEIHIEDEEYRKLFKKQFIEYIDHLISMGINDSRVTERMNDFKLINLKF